MLLGAGACGAGSTSHRAATSGFDGAALPANLPVRDFTLTDQSGRPVSLAAYHGQVVILAFLSTSCGAACTLIAQQIRGALDELPRPVPVLLVSADPSADTGARIKRFLASVGLSGRVRYLTGSLAALQPVTVTPVRVAAPASNASAKCASTHSSGKSSPARGS